MGYGEGLGCRLKRNAQVTIPGGLGFGREPLGGSLRPDMGHASEGYGEGLGRRLEKNDQVTTPDGLGFGRDPLGGSLRPDMGHASDPMWPALIGLLAKT
ncbi:hypothetical protein Hanom_Chr06g00511441 [Helianthus anomalus]